MRAPAAPDSMRAKLLIVKLPSGWADISTNRPIVITASNSHRSAPSIIGRRMVNKDIRQPPPLMPVFKCVKTVSHRSTPQSTESNDGIKWSVCINQTGEAFGVRRSRPRFPIPCSIKNLGSLVNTAALQRLPPFHVGDRIQLLFAHALIINDFSVFSVTSVAIHPYENRCRDYSANACLATRDCRGSKSGLSFNARRKYS